MCSIMNTPRKPMFEPTASAFAVVRKNRDACIHWLLQPSQLIEVQWAADALQDRVDRLTLLRDCLSSLAEHAHADCRELAALVPRMMHTLDFDERHFLNLMLPIERRHSRGLVRKACWPASIAWHPIPSGCTALVHRASPVAQVDHDFLVTTDDASSAAAAAAARLPLVLVLDHLRSAFNVGSIFRTADCLGVRELHLCGYTATPDDAQVHRTTMGSHQHLPWRWWKETRAAIHELRGAGMHIVALETVAGAPPAAAYPFPRSGCALLLGNERHGLSQELLALCDGVVRLPARGVKNSMNVGVALGMCGYEVVRQWVGSQDDGAVAQVSAEPLHPIRRLDDGSPSPESSLTRADAHGPVEPLPSL